MADFIVEGVELEDGSRTELFSADNSAECRDWLTRYTRRPDADGRAGGWSLIEIYDMRGEDAERLAFWEREETNEVDPIDIQEGGDGKVFDV